MKKHVYIGIDIGGTTIKIGVISRLGQIIHKWEIPTNLENNGAYIISELWNSISKHLQCQQIDQSNIIGIGVGAPGFIDRTTGIVYEAVNIGWKNFHLKKQLEDISKLPVFITNDANIAALGEVWQGAGDGSDHLIAITLGTGVGGGIITNGEIISGANGTAGEIGHMTIDPNGSPCNCGRRGCLETIASATGIVRQALEKVAQYPSSHLANVYREKQTLTAKDVFDLAITGEVHCKHIVHEVSHLLGYTIANLAVLTNPAKVLIGGGLSKAGDYFLHLIKDSFEKYALPRIKSICEIKIAELGNDAGIIGAAYFVKQNLRS